MDSLSCPLFRRYGFPLLVKELVEQAATLAGERLSEPIRAAGSKAVRLVMLAGSAVASLVVALAFLGAGIGLAIGRAPESMRWWICLLVALGFLVLGGTLGAVAIKGSRPEADVDEQRADKAGEG